jgi:hypothetical protein
MTNMIRKLRIAFSAVCGIVCLLVIVLWVRSYWRSDLIEGKGVGSRHHIQIGSLRGFLGVDYHYSYATFFRRSDNWRITSKPADDLNVGTTSWYGKILHNSNQTAIIVPYWIVLLPFVALGVFPWLNRMKQFSLRTLLLATTLIAVLLGMIVFLTGK